MSYKEVGFLLLIAGALIVGCGLFLRRKFHAAASYKGIGSFKITWRGLVYFMSILLIIFGMSTVFVGILLLLT